MPLELKGPAPSTLLAAGLVVEALMLQKERSFSTPEGWLFANPMTGRPYHQEEIQKVSQRGSGAISAGIRSGTATGPGSIRPGRLSPSKRS